VGILHKDIKPSNILVHQDNPDAPLVTMIDFGIGMLADRDALARKGITALGLTEQSLAEDLALSGTRLYMAPELLEAKPLTTRSDIYSLGVVLFQVAVGDFSRTVATGWEREISDPLLCDDISHCVDGDPTRRIAAAEDLAVRLRSLDQRRLEAEEEARRQAAEEHSRRRARRLMGYCLAGVAIAAVASLMALTEWQNAVSESRFRLEAESARADAERHREIAVEARRRAEVEQYTASIHAAEARLNEQRIEKVLDTLLNRTPEYLRNWEWGWLLTQTAPEDMAIARQNLTHAAFSPDGKRFVTSDLSGYVTIRDCTTGRRLLSSHPHEKGIWSTIFSPDGRQILTTSWDRQACILDAATGQTCFTLKGHGDIVRGAAFSPDGRFAVTTGRADRTARIWDTGTGTGILTITDPGEGFYVADYSSDGKRVATGSLGGAVRIWNAATGAVQVELTTHPATVTGIAFHPGGERLVTACKDGKARIFDAVSGGLFREIASPKSTMGYCAWSPDGNMIGTAEDDGACRLWDPASGRLLLALQADDPMWKLDFSPDSKRILTTSRRSVRLWNLDRLRAKSVIVKNDESETTMPVDTLRVAGFPPERDPTWNSLDRVWNTTAGATMIEAGGRHFRVDSRYAAFSPDRSLSIHFDKPTSYSATVMDCRSGKPVRNLGPDAVYDADFSPDGTCAAVMRFSGPIVLFNASDWSVMRTFETGNVRNWAVRFSPDGRRLAGAGGDLESGGHVTVWDVASGRKEVALSSSRDDQAFSLAFSPDCRLLAAGYADDRVRVWDLADKKAKWTLAGHSRPVIAVGFSPDCKRLVTASIDNTVKIWGLDGGRELVTAISTTGKSSLLGAGFSGDGEAVCAVTSDGTMQVAEAFPWDDRIDPTLASVPIDERLELWKRRHRLLPTIGPDDLK
jgi:WD40 repeat protein